VPEANQLNSTQVHLTSVADAAGGGGGDGERPVDWLRDEEIEALLSAPRVQRALEQIAASPEALGEWETDAVLMGLLLSVCATRGAAIAALAAASPNPTPSPHPDSNMKDPAGGGAGGAAASAAAAPPLHAPHSSTEPLEVD